MQTNSKAMTIKKGITICFLIAFTFVWVTGMVHTISASLKKNQSIAEFQKKARLITKKTLTPHEIPDKENAYYFTTAENNTLLFSRFFAPKVTGYGGPMELLILLDKQGKLSKLEFLKHRETPRWIQRIGPWLKKLTGRPIVTSKPLPHVDTVTGATYTTRAVLQILKKSGSGLNKILNNDTGKPEQATPILNINLAFILLGVMSIIALLIRRKPQKPVRLLFMAAVVLIGGFWLNLQLSTYHILSFAQGQIHITGFDTNLFFYIILPVMILFAGNIYCGHLCPFGLLQELVGELFFFIKIPVPQKVNTYGRLVKYILLFLIILSPMVKALFPLSQLDILLSAFTFDSPLTISLVAGVLILSALSNRFWCKYLCPTGAGLSLLHGVSLLLHKKIWKNIPVIKNIFKYPHIKKCDLGVVSVKDNNCICCDRCRYQEG